MSRIEALMLESKADEFLDSALNQIGRGSIPSVVGLLTTARGMFEKLNMAQHVELLDKALEHYRALR